MYELSLARGYLKRGSGFVSLISGFSFAGITIGVAALIIVMAVMNGFHERLTSYIIGSSGHIRVFNAYGEISPEDQSLEDKISALPGVYKVLATQRSEAMFLAGEQMTGVYLHGIRPEDLTLSIIANAVQFGSLEQFDRGTVAIGSALAKSLHVGIGDTITIAVPHSFVSIIGAMPNMQDYVVSVIFEVGMLEYDSSIGYIGINDYVDLFDLPGTSFNNLAVTLLETKATDRIAQDIRQLTDLEVQTWEEGNYHFLSAVRIERVAMFMILTLIVIVAAFNIVSSLVILAQEKKFEIAILKTLGASSSSITAIFLLCGAFIGFCGTGMGVALGLLFAYNLDKIKRMLESFSGMTIFDPLIYFFNELPVIVEISNVAWICLLSLSLSLLAAVFPAWRASRYSPVDLLKG